MILIADNIDGVRVSNHVPLFHILSYLSVCVCVCVIFPSGLLRCIRVFIDAKVQFFA